MDTNEIINFWFPNNNIDKTSMFDFWFDKSVDEFIKLKYLDLVNNFDKILINSISNPLDKIALLVIGDQFTRNIFRDSDNKTKNDNYTLAIALDILNKNEDINYNLNMRYIILLVLRHQKKTSLLNIVITKIKSYFLEFNGKIPDSLIKFYSHTIKSFTYLLDDIQIYNSVSDIELYDLNQLETSKQILDERVYLNQNNSDSNLKSDKLYNLILGLGLGLKKEKKEKISIGISLSGGVDSMVLLHLLIKIRDYTDLIDDIVAIHIEHTNREEAILEKEYLVKLSEIYNFKLYVRTIYYMDRSMEYIDRNIYEVESKKLRFNLYKYAIESNNLIGICLGHHMGDITENVLTNIIKGHCVENLGVMKKEDNQFDVQIFRPFITITKDDIFDYSYKFNVPYFKNSTPVWSCRGVLRDQVIPILKKQFGNIEPNIIKVMNNCSEMVQLNQKYVIQPYLDSLIVFKHGAKIILNNDLIIDSIWSTLLMKILYSFGIKMISNKSRDNFIEWLKKLYDSQNIQRHQIELNKECFAYYGCNYIYIIMNNLNIDNIVQYNNLDSLLDENMMLESESKIPDKIKKLKN